MSTKVEMHGTTILASRAVYECCHGAILFRPLGEAHAKGRREEIDLYEVAGIGTVAAIDAA